MRRLAFLLLPFAAACAMTEAARPAATLALAGTRWVGVVEAGTDPAITPRLEFIEARLQGFTGCNLMGGAWRVEGNEVRFSAIAATRRGCMGPAGEIEKRVLAAMGEQSRVRVEGDRLVVESPAGRFEFRKAP